MNNRLLDDADEEDKYNYYAEPVDEDIPKGKTIVLLTIFGILIAISVGYFVAKQLFPKNYMNPIEERPEEDNIDSISYELPRSRGGGIEFV